MQIADHHAQANPTVGQHLVQPVLLRGQLADQLLPLTGNQAQFPQFGRRHKRSAQQTRARQRRQPEGIAHIRLAPWHILDVPRIHHLGTNAHRFQRRIRALPVDAGAFHNDLVGAQRGDPGCQFPTILLERAKLPLLDARTTVGFLDQRTGRDLRLMDVEPDDAFVQRYQFHTTSYQFTLKGGRSDTRTSRN